jgi:hypothetical protein
MSSQFSAFVVRRLEKSQGCWIKDARTSEVEAENRGLMIGGGNRDVVDGIGFDADVELVS